MKFEKYVYCFINDSNKKTCGSKTEVPLILMDFAFYLKKKYINKRIPMCYLMSVVSNDTFKSNILDLPGIRDHSYITSALVWGEGGQKMPIFAYS